MKSLFLLCLFFLAQPYAQGIGGANPTNNESNDTNDIDENEILIDPHLTSIDVSENSYQEIQRLIGTPVDGIYGILAILVDNRYYFVVDGRTTFAQTSWNRILNFFIPDANAERILRSLFGWREQGSGNTGTGGSPNTGNGSNSNGGTGVNVVPTSAVVYGNPWNSPGPTGNPNSPQTLAELFRRARSR